MPTTLCTACLALANTSYKFQQQCNKSQIILETYLTQVKVKTSLNDACTKKSISNFHDVKDSDDSLDGSNFINVNPNDTHSVQNNLDNVQRDNACRVDDIVKHECDEITEENKINILNNDDVLEGGYTQNIHLIKKKKVF